jgi:proteasome lid subunit RPN8/RPN11
MHLTTDYDLILEVRSPSGEELARTLVPQPERYADDARFSGICAGQLPPTCVALTAHLRPLWHQAGADPALLGFAIDVCCACDGRQHTFTKSYGMASLQRHIRTAVQPQRDSGQRRLEAVNARLYAFRKSPVAAHGRRLHSVPEVLPLPFVSQPLTALRPDVPAVDAASTPFGVLVSAGLLREITAETLRSIGTEQAGILVGRLCHDPQQQRGFLHVTAQVLADTQVTREAAAFHFRPETFLAAQRMINLRGQGEIAVGWWHSHAWCQPCLSAVDCRANTLFFSDQDCQVHETAFTQPYMVALVVGKAASKPMREPQVQMYGWHDGAIMSRDFVALPAS